MERQPDEQSQECDIISLIFNLLYDFEMAFCDILHEKQVKVVPKCYVQSHILLYFCQNWNWNPMPQNARHARPPDFDSAPADPSSPSLPYALCA